MRTPGFAGADLANLLNESAILAGRRGLKVGVDGGVDGQLCGRSAARVGKKDVPWAQGGCGWSVVLHGWG